MDTISELQVAGPDTIDPELMEPEEPFALSHRMTAKSLNAIGEIGGPRCCKRDSYLSVLSAIDYTAEHFGIQMDRPEIICRHSFRNNQCIGKRCPFAGINHKERLCQSFRAV